ncbi:MAG: chemotaxis protein CheC [Promethearchaeota archaeon]
MATDKKKISTLTENQKDALSEIANIATGKAILALSKMMSPKIRLNLVLKEMNVQDLFDIKGFNLHSEDRYIGVRALLKQDILGVVYMIFPINEFLQILKEIEIVKKVPESIEKKEDLDTEDLSTVIEIGNIIISHYCSAISDFLKINLYHDVPEVAIGEYTGLIDSEIAKMAMDSDQAVFIQTNMIIEDKDILGEFLFIPYSDYMTKFIKLLNVETIVDNMD